MSASVCPACSALLTTRERAQSHCPKCSAALPEPPSVRTLSNRKKISRVDLFNTQSFCYRISLACLALSIVGLILGCVAFQSETADGIVNYQSIGFSILAVVALFGSAIAGFFGLGGGIRGQWLGSIILSAMGLILGGVQLAFWFVSIAGIFSRN